MIRQPPISIFFFFNDTATTEIYTLSLHDALPISSGSRTAVPRIPGIEDIDWIDHVSALELDDVPESSSSADRKSTRLNSSHLVISYAVFCLKKKKKNE